MSGIPFANYKNASTLHDGEVLRSDKNTGGPGGMMLSSGEINKNDISGAADWCNLIMQSDGNLVLYFVQCNTFGSPHGFPKWDTRTQGKGPGPFQLSLDRSGNLIVTNGRGAELWRAPHRKAITKEPCRLIMQDDANLVLYDANNAVIWASDTPGQTHK